MKQYLFNNIIIVVALLSVCSCNNDYQYPDLSNATPIYSIKDINSEVRSLWIEEAKQYGLSFDVSREKWVPVVEEMDINGNILYSGVSRGRADHNAKELRVGYICQQRVSTVDNNYYDVCTFWLEKRYKLEISPITCDVVVSTSDNYSIKEADSSKKVYPYNLTWDGSVVQLMIKTCETLGYEISGTQLNVVEKDKEGNTIYSGTPKNNSETKYISHLGAYTLDAIIEFYGWPEDNKYRDKAKVGAVSFSLIKLSPFVDIVLTTDMEYSLQTFI